MSELLERVHETSEAVETIELTPAHPPREETPIYRATHHKLVVEEDTPCIVCGVKNSTLDDPKQNPFGAKALETHHFPIERSLLEACDWQKVKEHFGFAAFHLKGPEDLEAFVDSEDNMMVVCDIHHRSKQYGIHHLLAQDWFIQPFLREGYRIAASKEEAAAIERADEALIEQQKVPAA